MILSTSIEFNSFINDLFVLYNASNYEQVISYFEEKIHQIPDQNLADIEIKKLLDILSLSIYKSVSGY